MDTKNKQDGYTLIETLVALTLLFILLFLVTDLIPIISNNAGSELKLKAIIAAKNRMEETLVTKNYTELTHELEKNMLLKQIIEEQEDKILIAITINHKKTKRVLHTLKAYVSKIE